MCYNLNRETLIFILTHNSLIIHENSNIFLKFVPFVLKIDMTYNLGMVYMYTYIHSYTYTDKAKYVYYTSEH